MAVLVSVAAIAAEESAGVAVEKPAGPTSFDWSELIQPPPATADRQQRDSFAAFTEALANASFSEAEIAAKQMVEGVNADAADAWSDRARALHNLAVAQQNQGSHDSAIQNYSAALDIIASEKDNLSPALILP